MAAAVFLFARTRLAPGPDEISTGERVKGAARVTFFVKHGDGVRAGVEHDRLEPGDAIQFSYSSGTSRYLAVLSVDGARHASVYYADGPRAVRLEPGVDVTLPQSTVLDDVLGDETVYALFCDVPIEVEPLRAALELSPEGVPVVPGCSVDRHTFVKSRP
jgi:hypothetical protein